ncbi:MAG: hypothetical protein JNL38_34555, partial [Myxococcales bacterium]|nr:hypothetical protein [Myxococcales bacterium]
AAVVSRATAISPAARFASAAAMRDALREALTRPPSAAPAWPAGPPGPPLDRPSSLSPPGAAVSAPPAGPRSPSPAAHALRQPAPPSRAGWVVAAIAAPAILLVLGGAGGAAWYVHNTRTGPAVGPVVLPAPTASASAPTAPSAAASAPSAATVASNATSPTSPPAPSLARSAPAASATASAPRVAPSAPPTATPGRRLAYTSSSPTYGNLYPAQADFIRVVDTHAPGLQRCFQDERVADSWTITFTVKFAHGRSLSAMVVHEGAVVGTGDPTAERLRNCTYNAVAMWPWPAAPQQAPDAGAPYVRFFVGMVWQGSHG